MLDLVNCSWDGSAEDSPAGGWAGKPACFGHEEVVFDSYAAEVPVLFNCAVIDERAALILGLPSVDQFGDEINSRLDGDDVAGFERFGEPQRPPAEGGITFYSVGVADVILAE